MMSSIGGRLRRAGVMAAWLPIATAAWAEEGDDHVSSTIAASADAAAFRVEIVGDALVIEGTPEDDRILIKATREPDTVRVIFNGVRLGHFGPLARIEVDAGDGDDTVLVSGAVELPARLGGGPDDDRLRGGGGPDLVFGEDGDDVLLTSLGRDALDGGPGDNRLVVRRPMGEIQVGSSAAGDALRILAKAYDLPPLVADLSATALGPIVVGPAELLDDDIVELLRTAYQAGHAIALAGAEAADTKLLRVLLGHASGGSWDAEIAQADLVAFRRAIRPDGRTHGSTSILLPRQEVELPRAEARRGSRQADLLAVEGLSGVFSGTPVVPELASGDGGPCPNVPPSQCLQSLADSYQSSTLDSNTSGDQVQIVNWVWALRSFMNHEDLYYIKQEVDYHLGSIPEFLLGWEGTAESLLDESPPPTTIQTSPQTTMTTTSVTSGVSETVGGAAGWNQTEGLNATLTGGVTISDTTTVQIPPIQVTNNTNLATGETAWVYDVDQLPDRSETITFYNQWIWEVPFTTYDPGQDTIQFTSQTGQSILTNQGNRVLLAELDSALPIPFGDTFALQPPVVTSVDPDDVCVGDEFTITGTGLYPTLVQAVLIDGEALDPTEFSAVSDTEITVVAPDIGGFELPVEVQTALALSNDDVTIEIDDILCAAARRTAPGVARTPSAATVTAPEG